MQAELITKYIQKNSFTRLQKENMFEKLVAENETKK